MRQRVDMRVSIPSGRQCAQRCSFEGQLQRNRFDHVNDVIGGRADSTPALSPSESIGESIAVARLLQARE
jgi:hypothetical protein